MFRRNTPHLRWGHVTPKACVSSKEQCRETYWILLTGLAVVPKQKTPVFTGTLHLSSCNLTIVRQLTYLLTYLFTYLLTHSLHGQSPSWESNQFSASQEIPLFYGNRMFVTAFSSARHLSLSWATSIQSVPPHPTSWRSILILSSHLLLGLFSYQKPVHASPLTQTRYMPRQYYVALDFLSIYSILLIFSRPYCNRG
jgi:hypothetical protein